MTRLRTLLVATALLGVALTAFTPTANAATCARLDGGGGGIVGATVDYVSNMEYATCTYTMAYLVTVCGYLIGPENCMIY